MTVTITLNSDIEQHILVQAQAEGIAVEEFLPRLIQRSLPLRQGSREWLALLQQPPPQVLSVDPATSKAPPVIMREDLRRENMYEDRA